MNGSKRRNAEEQLLLWDNDSLACLVGTEVDAGLIVLLSDVDGLYKKLPAPGEVGEIVSLYMENDSYNLEGKSNGGK